MNVSVLTPPSPCTRVPLFGERGFNGQVAMSALGSGRAYSPRLSLPTVRAVCFSVHSRPPMCSGLCSLPKWFGLRPLGLYRVRRTSWSVVTPVLDAFWLAPGWCCSQSSLRPPLGGGGAVLQHCALLLMPQSATRPQPSVICRSSVLPTPAAPLPTYSQRNPITGSIVSH